MYGAVVTVADPIRAGMVNAFRPRSSPPSTATVLRSALWPIAIMSIIHRSYVLTSNGYITDDWAPVYRAVRNFRAGADIYNENFDHVDPHYLYPPGGTLLMAYNLVRTALGHGEARDAEADPAPAPARSPALQPAE